MTPAPARAIAPSIGQLPLWHEGVRGLPNPMARSALFTVGNKTEPRSFYKTDHTITALAGYTITYRGEELRQDDEDVFLQLVHMARKVPLGEKVEFAAYGFLKELGWSKSKDGYNRLRATLKRLQLTGLSIACDSPGNEGSYTGPLIMEFAFRGKAGEPLTRWFVTLNGKIVNLFGSNAYTQVWWDQRMRLKSAVAKYLHSYYATHEHPYPIKVATLQALTGSRLARLTDFRKSLRKSLDMLIDVGFLAAYEISAGDLVRVERSVRPARTERVAC